MLTRVPIEKVWPGSDKTECARCGNRERVVKKVTFDRFWDRLRYGSVFLCLTCFEKAITNDNI